MSLRKSGADCPYDAGGLMRRGVLALVVLLLACLLMAGAVSAEEPTQVSTWADLKDNLTQGKSVILSSNIGSQDNPVLLGKDDSENTTVILGKRDLTLDLSTWTIYARGNESGHNSKLITLGNDSASYSASLTVKASSGGIQIDNETDKYYGSAFCVLNNSKLTIESGSFKVKNGFVASTHGAKFEPAETIPMYQNAEIVITGGTLESENDNAIYLPGQGSKLTINGGTIKGVAGIDLRTGEVIINGGSIEATGPKPGDDERKVGYSTNSGAAIALTKQSAYPGQPKVTINGGTLKSTYNVAVFNYVNSTDTCSVKIRHLL